MPFQARIFLWLQEVKLTSIKKIQTPRNETYTKGVLFVSIWILNNNQFS